MLIARFIKAIVLLLAAPVFAGPVQLISPGGEVFVEGTLLSRDGELFRVETAFGPVTVDAGALRCSGAGCPDPADMVARTRVTGDPDLVFRLLPALLEVFSDTNALVAIRSFKDDTAVLWSLRDAETDRLLAEINVEATETGTAAAPTEPGTLNFTRIEADEPVRQDVVALDALVPAVAPQNPRVVVTLSQLRELLSGDITSWARLDGPDLPVSLHFANGWSTVAERVLGGRAAADGKTHGDFAILADTVAASPQALGLIPYSSIGNAVPLVISGACGLATPATRDTIRAEDYPLTQPVFLQRIGARQPKILRDFIAFARSPEAQPVIRAAGFTDQAIARIGFEHQGDRIANAVLTAGDDVALNAEVRDMIGTLLDGERLTLSFRFLDGSSDLDTQSVSNIQRLADAISAGQFDNHQILFVGFSDAAGPHDGNLRLSDRRARAVRRAVAARVAEAPVDFEVAAFGELMPMACDDTPWGGQVNRRVEVWVKPLKVAR